ncbi:SLOG family protein [Bombilactobacillus bombi]|uniref:SLOG family protein n=1 Tax=Bombilactobacillus bombi TaxID=1303590 RepID=UPI001F079174|nr:SLOG family protein [Bombilactobacillus bombi]
MENIKNLWVSGYRSYELGIFQDEDPKKKIIMDYLTQILQDYCEDGLQWILTGGQLGIEQYTIETVKKNSIFQTYHLKTAIMLPFTNIANNWSEKNQQRFALAQQQADYVNSVSAQDYVNPSQFTNWQQFMLQHTDAGLMVYDLEHPGKAQYEYRAIKQYQKEHDYDLRLVDFYDLQDFIDAQVDF